METLNRSRRNFLRAKPAEQTPLRPPWLIDESHLLQHCSQCDDCRSACPEQIIFKGDGGYPEVQFTDNACTFCQACADVCQAPIFSSPRNKHNAWAQIANIEAGCLAKSNISCQSCQDACEEQAIKFKLQVGMVAQAVLEANQCTGCGACLSVCPADSISLLTNKDQTDECHG